MSVTINGSGSITGVSTLTGNIGINTNPVKTLHVNATAENQYAIARISGRNRGGQLEFCTDATKNSGMYSPTSTDALVFFTGAAETEAARFNSSGNLAFPSGQGIDFSATSDGTGVSGVSELFDDYEEGVWTPTLSSGTCSVDRAHYVKIGNFVRVAAVLQNFSDTTTTSAVNVTGLPFTDGRGNGHAAGSAMSKGCARVTPVTYLTADRIQFYGNNTANSWIDLRYSDLDAGHHIYFQASWVI
jgi:hypothetical protein